MVKNKDKWSALSMSERADLIKLYVSSGITSLDTIKKDYNSFAPGGPLEVDEYGYPVDITPAVVEADYPREAEVWKRADASNADMVQRLKQGSSRVTISDWKDPRKVATHKMMSAGNYVVGNVQNINGQLFDFTDPKHGFENPDRAAIDSAIERGDYIEFDTEGDARYFAEHYKKHYNSFDDGGDKSKVVIGEILPSQAVEYNQRAGQAAFMIPYGGTPDNPEFLYPEELEAAVALASAKEAKQKAIEKEVAKLNSSDAWKYIGRRQGENFEANQHAREYVEPIVDAAVGGIGTAMAMANPVTTELAIDALGKLGHAGHVVINPLAAETMFGAALGTAGNAWLTAGGIYRNSELINKWIGPDGRPLSGDGSFNWSDLPEFGLNLLGVAPTAGVMARTFDKASDVYNTYKTSQAISKAGKAVSKARAEKIKEFGPDWGGNINAPGNAESIPLDKNATITNKQLLGQLSSKNPSKLSEAEKAGYTKHERTNAHNPTSETIELLHTPVKWRPSLDDYWDTHTNMPSQHMSRAEAIKKMKELGLSDYTAINMHDFVKTLPDEINPLFAPMKASDGSLRQNPYITLFREGKIKNSPLSNVLSDNDIAKFLTYYDKQLLETSTGQLKDVMLWHTSPKNFDIFDYTKFLGSTRGNTGFYGPGNYFSTHIPIEHFASVRGGYNYQGIRPFRISGIEQTIPSDIVAGKPGFNIGFTPISEGIPIHKSGNIAIIGSNTSGPGYLFRSYVPSNFHNTTVQEVVIPRNTGIKTLFADPSRFVRNADGSVSFTPVDWNDLRVDFKNGGKLLTKNNKYNSYAEGGDKNTTSSQQNANPFIVPSFMPNPYWQKTLEDAKKIVEYKYRKYSKDELREHINNVRAGIETEFTYPDGTVVFRKKDSPTEPEYPINLTGIGDAVEAYNVIQNAGNGNLKAAALSASLLLLPDFLGKTFKKGTKAASKTTRRAAPEVDVQNAGYINSIDDVTLDPYARTEVPEEAFMPKANPVNEVKKKVALTEAELQAEFKSLYNNQKVKAILDRPDVSEYVLNYRGAANVDPKLDFNKLREILIKEGVKPELLTDVNLSKLMAARYADYTANITNNMALRNNILIDHPIQPHVYEYTQFRPEGNVGYAYIYDNTPLGNKVGMVENTTSGVSRAKGVSEQAYNSVIGDLGNMTSGELLLDADATMKVLSKYPDKTVLSSGTGTHWYKTGHEYGDIFMLNSPTYEVPVKYIDEFGLEGVSPEGSFIVDFTKGPTYKNGGKLLTKRK